VKWERIEPWDYIVVSVASEYHKKFNMVELADVKQSLYQWFVEHPNKLTEWETIGNRDAKNLIYRSLRNQALDYCQRWKAKSLGYEIDDVFYYDPAIVEVLLPSVLRKELLTPAKENSEGPKQPSAPAEGGNLVTMMVEVDIAYFSYDSLMLLTMLILLLLSTSRVLMPSVCELNEQFANLLTRWAGIARI
jgi:hypothetical protein